MNLPIATTVQGRDVMWSKSKDKVVAAGAYKLRDRGEIAPVAPGAASAWFDLTPFLVSPADIALWKTKAGTEPANGGFRAFELTVRARGQELPKVVRWTLELSRGPGERPYFVRAIERDGPTVIVVVPHAGLREKAFLDEDESRMLLGYLKGLNLPGKLPEMFYPHFNKSNTQSLPPAIREMENEIVRQMGDNPRYHSLHLYGANGPKTTRVAQEKALEAFEEYWPARQIQLETNVPAAVAAGEPLGVWLDCEYNLHPDDNEFMRNDPEERRLFREYLKAQGLRPEEFGWKSWDQAKMQYRDDPGELNPMLFWQSAQFRFKRVGQFFAQMTQEVEKRTLALPGARPDRIYIGPYHSEGHILVNGGYGIFRQGGDWWNIERERKGNTVRSEDFPLANADKWWLSQEVETFILDNLWSVAKRRNEAMAFDICAVSGSVPAELRWRIYATLGRGVRVIDHEYHGPPYIQFTFSLPNHLSSMAEFARTYRRIATAEDLLAEGRQPDARVAILDSQATDLWAGWPDTPEKMEDQYIIERQLLYYALRHRGIPVEFVDEQAILDNGLKDYQVLYLCGRHLRRACAGKIRDWVADGGTLYSETASGLLDEYNRPNPTLLEVCGLNRANITGKARGGAAHPYLAGLGKGGVKPAATVTAKAAAVQFPAWDIVARLEPKTASTVLATFGDGSPAMLRSSYGKGTALVTGAMPALEYGRQALGRKTRFGDRIPLDSAGKKLVKEYPFYFNDDPVEYADHTIAVGFSKPLRDLICLPVTWAGVTPKLQLSHAVVDGVLLAAKKGVVVTLVNYLVDPIPDFAVSVALEPGQRVASVWSTERLKEVPFTEQNGRVTIRLGLDLAEMLAIRFK